MWLCLQFWGIVREALSSSPWKYEDIDDSANDESCDESVNEAENIDQGEDNVITIDDIEPCLRKVKEAMEKVKLALE